MRVSKLPTGPCMIKYALRSLHDLLPCAGYRSGTATGYQQGLEKGKQATLSAFAQLKGKMGAS